MAVGESLPGHCSGEEFHSAFRADLLKVAREAIVLSPFLSTGRAAQYYALLADLIAREVRVVVYTKPEAEIAGTAREEHACVSGSLRALKVDLRQRKAMHEKLAALDGTILWHGSLNILSHGSSTESMLRVVRPELVRTVLDDLRLLDAAGENLPLPDPVAVAVHDAPPDCLCPRCGTATVVRRGAHTLVVCPAPECGFAFDERLSRWLLSAQARRRPS
jgi:hypothetical protein